MKEYDLLARLVSLSASPGDLAGKLKEAASMVLDLSGTDESLIYLLDAVRGRFELAAEASTGRGTKAPKEYGAADGLVRRLLEDGRHVEVHEGDPEFDPREDRGLEGYRSAWLFPLTAGDPARGVLYLKALSGDRLDPGKAGLLTVAAAGVSALLELVRERASASEEIAHLEERLRNAEKFMALGDMAATLAHELKNPLLSLGGFARRLKKKLAKDSPGLKYLDLMLEEITRLEKVTDGALRVLREETLDLKAEDMNEIVASALELFEEDLEARRIEVIRELERGSLPVMVDREQIKIAFDNLIANAIQSMDCGGTLRLSTVSSGDFVVTEVADSGGGIDPEHLENIFNPFFTTKEKGTGLGLPITHSIVERHMGEIAITNRPGEGVTFHVRIPLACKEDA